MVACFFLRSPYNSLALSHFINSPWVQLCGFNYHLYEDDSHVFIPSSQISTHIFSCLLDISYWESNRQLGFNLTQIYSYSSLLSACTFSCMYHLIYWHQSPFKELNLNCQWSLSPPFLTLSYFTHSLVQGVLNSSLSSKSTSICLAMLP